VSAAERALHRRTGLACAAAVGAGVAGRFRVWGEAGLLAMLASDPAFRARGRSRAGGQNARGRPRRIGGGCDERRWGSRGRRFKSCRPDGLDQLVYLSRQTRWLRFGPLWSHPRACSVARFRVGLRRAREHLTRRPATYSAMKKLILCLSYDDA
jgi:hypothetical protein